MRTVPAMILVGKSVFVHRNGLRQHQPLRHPLPRSLIQVRVPCHIPSKPHVKVYRMFHAHRHGGRLKHNWLGMAVGSLSMINIQPPMHRHGVLPKYVRLHFLLRRRFIRTGGESRYTRLVGAIVYNWPSFNGIPKTLLDRLLCGPRSATKWARLRCPIDKQELYVRTTVLLNRLPKGKQTVIRSTNCFVQMCTMLFCDDILKTLLAVPKEVNPNVPHKIIPLTPPVTTLFLTWWFVWTMVILIQQLMFKLVPWIPEQILALVLKLLILKLNQRPSMA